MRDQSTLFNFILCTVMFLSVPAFATQDSYPFTSTQDRQRFLSLTQEVRCVVCQNQNIADSNAPLASDLRNKVYRMILDKKTNREIKNYLVKRYGEFILLEPRFTPFNLFLWTFPFLALCIVLIIFMRYLKQQSQV